MLYTIKIVPQKEHIFPVKFRFNTFAEMEGFLRDAIAAVDGFDAGETAVIVSREEESPTDCNH